MSSLQDAKSVVRAHYAALATATTETVQDVLAATHTGDCLWRGFHPFNERHGPHQIAKAFWQPYLRAMSHVQRREDIFFAGRNDLAEGGVWVVSMGHLMALFDAAFLNIPPTRKIAMLRYCEFNRVEHGRITDTAFFCDLPHLMRQAGISPFPDQTAAHLVQPGPMTHDGLLYAPQDPDEGRKTLTLVERMIGAITIANEHPDPPPPQEELRQTWAEDMLWWGPEGIGATYTIERYIEQHQAPFRAAIGHRIFNGHVARLAEGNYGGFFGWPNLKLLNSGGFMGLPASDTYAEMRVIDLYRRAGDKLAENWIFIDMLHFAKMQGVDVLGALAPA